MKESTKIFELISKYPEKVLEIKHNKAFFTVDIRKRYTNEIIVTTCVFNGASHKKYVELSNRIAKIFEDDIIEIDCGSDDIYFYSMNKEILFKFLDYFDLKDWKISFYK